jgi:inhibitor of cysteine peptidase
MVPKSLALFCLALVLIAGMIAVSACTSTVTPSATPSATPSVAPSVTPLPSSNNTIAAYNQSDKNKTVNAKTGETFTVTLDDNPSTGYAWNVSVTSGLTIVNDTYLPANTTLVGVPGLHVWRITANGTGNQSFGGIYRRPQEPLIGNETTYLLNVSVVAPMLGALP